MSNNLGATLKDARETKGFSISQLANLSGISIQQIINIETGKTKKPEESTLQKIARSLALDFPKLLKQFEYYDEKTCGKIQRIRKEKGIEILGLYDVISRDQIRRIEKGLVKKPELRTLQALAKYLELDYIELLRQYGYLREALVYQTEWQNATIGQKIAKMRNIKKLSRKELAKRTGITYVQISNIETGKTKKPQKSTIELLEKCLEIDLSAY